MNVLLGRHLEEVVRDQVKNGLYRDGSEVVRDALRHMFAADDSDDTEALAHKLRKARNSPRKAFRPGEFRKLAMKLAAKRKQGESR